MSGTAPAIIFEKVRVERGRRRIVDDVSFAVDERSVHALLGHNGAGKTTLLRAAAGLVGVRSGQVRAEMTPSVLFVGGRYPSDLAVGQIVEHRARLLGVAARDADRALTATGTDEFLMTRGTALSTGMAQRLSISLALLTGARTLVLDEPTSGLDPQGVERLRGILLSLRDAGRTVLVCSHDLAELELVCDAVTCLRQGRVTATGTIEHVADGLPTAGQVVRTSDDTVALDALHDAGISAGRTARGIRVTAETGLRRLVAALPPAVEIVETTVDRSLFARIYDRYASEPSHRRHRSGRSRR